MPSNGSNTALKIESSHITHPDYTQDELYGLVAAIQRSQAVIEFDLDGTIITANENFLKAMGYSLNEVQGQHHSLFATPEYAKSPEYKEFWAKLKRGEFDAGQYKRLGKGGKEIWIQASYNPIFNDQGEPFKVVKFATDITQEKMRNTEYEGKIAAIDKSQAVIEFDLDGTIITANENFLKTMGYTLSEIQGQHHSLFAEPDYAKSLEYKQFWQKLNQGEFDSGQYKRLGKAGKEIWIQASYNPILNADGQPYKVVKFATDLTNEKLLYYNLVNSFDEACNQLSAASEELSATAKSMSENAQKTSETSEEASSTAETVSSGVSNLVANTEEMSASIKEVAKSSSEASNMSSAAKEKAGSANKIILELGTASEEIGNVIKVISSIAQQTNLLALNATIEAARAGEAGKGFAVVANEVKELAKQTATATDDITNKIGNVQGSSKEAVEAIRDINEAIEQLNSIALATATAVEEQSATTNEVSRVLAESSKSVEDIASAIKMVSHAASDSAAGSEQTLSASMELAKMSGDLKKLVEEAKLR